MNLRPYPEGIDCVWLASDREGHLGAFITAGIGPIPVVALDAGNMPVEDVEEQLCQLPPVSQAQLLVSVNRPDDFIDLAERGLFVYDWTDVNRTGRDALHAYEPVAVPSKPIAVSSLPSDLAAFAETLRLRNVVFSAGGIVDIRVHLSCSAG
ncbi:MAG: hypothetical protein JNN30_06360 [Rhodanobacteraceae bacterium]|nr:hypothetical protein [Rhodanobacteraceae bacterium]